MQSDWISMLGLYGDRTFFELMLVEGCDAVAFGSGPRVGMERVAHIVAFYRKERIVATLEKKKVWLDHGGSCRICKHMQHWWFDSRAKRYLSRWRVQLGEPRSLRSILDGWDFPPESAA
ncbi:MAG: hypothetical protein A2681_02560 [Candidatus Liptonbacteria bacterium RIFCSPHIGHO2_01_FULL_56_18b]|nr:MAG: hypothetical protein UY96_C0011G0001 [Parcubacteria group bacterium GW2011_GWB1_56_8]OGY98089.1 MAG: hypothetical protein A2681_02560 [Candidatus Liptonbacteria bacterium RIFCSPHIGHO2_01_FULL_56_18b]